ncbi:hypothetical protein OTU49_016073 [Cherax quadricarinatus]|uniref:DNA-3-methyladenine glycosylase n=1 Tax=Cherax quadricarinatus TaxID=27406 RepID=A0AAW0YRZ5_CHEQU
MSKRYRRKLLSCTKMPKADSSSSSTQSATLSPYFLEQSSGEFAHNDSESGQVMKGNIEGSDEEFEEEIKANRIIGLMKDAHIKRESNKSCNAQSSEKRLSVDLRLSEDFFDQDSIALAKALLGQVVVRVVDGIRISGAIVETESYLGGPDVASHSYNGKRTSRTEPMYMKPGTSYVYSIYGMYHCFNISSKGDGSCVLIRALEPLEGLPKMETGRNQRRKSSTPLKIHELCNGPSKICQAFYLTKVYEQL